MQRLFSIILLLSSLLIPGVVSAAQITILPIQVEAPIGKDFLMEVSVDTKHENINTFSGTLSYPKNLLEVKEIRTGNSVVNYWVEQPKDTGGTVRFAGMTPGGYEGAHDLIFSIVFTAQNAGQGMITVTDGLFLKNDGFGSTAPLTVNTVKVSVTHQEAASPQALPTPEDHTPPEHFSPIITHDPSLYNGKWTLVFATTDKESGINHYEVQEPGSAWFRFLSPWETAKSPYLLRDQSGNRAVYVRAVDNQGNIREEVATAPEKSPWNSSFTFILLFIALFFAFLAAKYLLWRRSENH